MTIQATPSEISYAADGVSTVFAIPFPFDTSADLKLTSTDTSGTILTLTTGFTISGGAGSTGNATFTVAPASGLTITIYDNPALTQPTNYVSLDAFPAESHEKALDRVTRIAKRLYQLVQRSVRFPDGDVSTDGVLGSVANRKGKYLFFNAVTGAIEYAANIVTTTLTQSIIGQLLNPQTLAESVAGVIPTNYFYLPGDVRRYGAKVDGATNDTAAIVTAISIGGKILGAPGTCMVSQITFNVAGISYYGNGMTFRGNSGIAQTAVVEVKTGNGCSFYDLWVDANFNPLYQCALHWYTNNLNIYYPGNCRFMNLTTSSALIGLCIGGLPTQSVPLSAQGVVVAAGLATDAPLSESYIFGFRNISCVRGLWMTQPNGKVHVSGQIQGTHAGWSSYGASGYTNASTVALVIRNDVTQASELFLDGGSLEQNTEATGTFVQVTNGHLVCEGTTIEANCSSYIAGVSYLAFKGCLNMGWQFAGSYSPFLIDLNASGDLCFSDSFVAYPSGGITGGTGSPFVKGASNIAGTYATNVNGFSVHFCGMELRDVPLAPLSGTASYAPTVQGVQAHRVNCKHTSYNGTPAITTQYDISDGTDLLRNVVDESAYIITAYGANGNATSGGWTVAVAGASSWGSAASGITQLEKVIDKTFKLFGAVGGSATATSAAFSIGPQHPYLLRGWIVGGATGASIVIQMNWFKFDGSASGTAVTTLLNAADTVIGATAIPFEFLAMPPKDATQAKLVLSAQNGATMQITDLSLR